MRLLDSGAPDIGSQSHGVAQDLVDNAPAAWGVAHRCSAKIGTTYHVEWDLNIDGNLLEKRRDYQDGVPGSVERLTYNVHGWPLARRIDDAGEVWTSVSTYEDGELATLAQTADGMTRRTRYVYSGRRLLQTFTDEDEDGVEDTREDYAYNADDLLERITTHDAEGTLLGYTEWAWDAKGRVASRRSFDPEGQMRSGNVFTWTGRTQRMATHYDGDGTPDRFEERDRDAEGRLIEYRLDFDGDGQWDRTMQNTYREGHRRFVVFDAPDGPRSIVDFELDATGADVEWSVVGGEGGDEEDVGRLECEGGWPPGWDTESFFRLET